MRVLFHLEIQNYKVKRFQSINYIGQSYNLTLLLLRLLVLEWHGSHVKTIKEGIRDSQYVKLALF